MSELAPRQQLILRAVVIEYVHAAEPVGSAHLTETYDLGVKSATVRNELSDMIEMGYLEQPHTSSGRIPSDKGYRYYVDNLLEERYVDQSRQSAVHKASQEGDVLQTLVSETTGALSRLTHLLSAGAIMNNPSLTIKSAIVSALGPAQALLVLALSNGQVESKVVECPAGMTLADVGRANELLHGATVGKSLGTLLKTKSAASGQSALDQLMARIWTQVRTIVNEVTKAKMVMKGEEFLFAQPEFRRSPETVERLMHAVQNTDALLDALQPTADPGGTVTIGSEHRSGDMHKLSVVRQTFYVGENEAGSIAVIGPTRMVYDDSVPLVNFAAKALTQALTKFFR